MRRIYLSPSNQPANLYAVGNTNEKVQLEAIMALVQDRLKAYQVETVMATLSYTINQRDDEAMAQGCTDYLAGHTNAGGGGTGQGAVAFYHPDHPETKALAEALVAELNAICPYKENRLNQVPNGMAPYNGYGLGEIREPAKKGIKPVLLEVDFHDNPLTARWIIDNKPGIADAIVRGLVKAYNLQPVAKPELIPVPTQVILDLSGMVKVTYDGVDGLNVRTSPDFGDNISQVVHKGEVFTVTGITIDGKLYRLKSGLYLTTSEKYVTFTNAPAGYRVKVAAAALNIRKGPGVAYPVTGVIHSGEVYTIVEEQAGWGRLKSGAGWVSLSYVDKI